MMSRGRIGGRSRLPTALLSRGSPLLRPGGSHLPPREGSSKIMPQRSQGMGKFLWVHTDLDFEAVLISVCLFVPLPDGSTVEPWRRTWTSYIQRFHLVIKYKKGTSNRMEYLRSHPPSQVIHILEVCCASYDAWKDLYSFDAFVGPIWEALHRPTEIN